jgi:hypothetical protein
MKLFELNNIFLNIFCVLCLSSALLSTRITRVVSTFKVDGSVTFVFNSNTVY